MPEYSVREIPVKGKNIAQSGAIVAISGKVCAAPNSHTIEFCDQAFTLPAMLPPGVDAHPMKGMTCRVLAICKGYTNCDSLEVESVTCEP